MRGAGFKCDQCARVVVDPMIDGFAAPQVLPEGWLVIATAAPPHAAGEQWHLCSWRCALMFAGAQAKDETDAANEAFAQTGPR